MLIKDMDAQARKEAANLAGPLMVSRGKIHRLEELPGCCVEDGDGNMLAAIFYNVQNGECEIVSLESRAENRGAGTKLIEAVTARARSEGCARVWLITSNDNTRAIRFYQKRGFDLKAVHRDAITEARKLKPSIPLIGNDGIPIRHELELEYLL
ncbi:Acetyltransferase (GNAT) family protein [Paenibacillus sophorae]|uniref:Acetyltransferase (GNAT) family protein n=1 Tax=Paenibacillus sophorae TaxID=1333845 RepID=A0A1H8JH00_9BACL|nr:GNAT family N-acetyltransferase [Paenibacillus sophorae]QWU13359.1 GNAT family N-acetyltransferase [Paenibacillus sophorae]SEN79901.1 Acetyltransferase (GNAT) family protein [Paenibacillus sophorae]